MTSPNFIPAHRLAAQQRRRRRRLWIVACIAYAAGLLVASTGGSALWHDDTDALTGRTAATIEQIDHDERATKRLQDKLAVARVTLQANRAVADQPDWSILLAAVADCLDDDVFLTRFDLQPAPKIVPPPRLPQMPGQPWRPPRPTASTATNLVTLVGFGRTQADVSHFVDRLERTGLFDKVKILRTKRRQLLTGVAVAFDLGCLMGEHSPRSRRDLP